MKILPLTLTGVLLSSPLALCQDNFTYSFVEADDNPWPSDWSGTTFSSEGHHATGWGFDSSTPSDDYTGAYIGDQFVSVVGAKYHNTASYAMGRDPLSYTMAWNVNGGKGFIDEGSSGKGPANQIFQMGFFNGTPTNTWFGKSLTNVSGADSLYLAGTEISASTTTQTGSLNLGVFDEDGTQLADFGTMNYTAVNLSNGDVHHFNFRQDLTPINGTQLTFSLWMDEYAINAANDTTTYLGQTSFGTQTITHGLNDLDDLVPGLGLSVKDFSTVSITAANYDGDVAVVVPEPSTLALLFGGMFSTLCYRKRS